MPGTRHEAFRTPKLVEENLDASFEDRKHRCANHVGFNRYERTVECGPKLWRCWKHYYRKSQGLVVVQLFPDLGLVPKNATTFSQQSQCRIFSRMDVIFCVGTASDSTTVTVEGFSLYKSEHEDHWRETDSIREQLAFTRRICLLNPRRP